MAAACKKSSTDEKTHRNENGWAADFAGTVEQGAVLASPWEGLVTLAQEGVLDGILDVVIMGQVTGNLAERRGDGITGG